MIVPKDISGKDLIYKLGKLGQPTRQAGSHIRLTTVEKGTHHITIPNHKPIKSGTLSSILKDIGKHFGQSKEEIWKIISQLH